MALAQVERLRAELAVASPDVLVEVFPLTTSGDRWQGDLAALGGKGAFTRELDNVLLDDKVDIVVHCLKDVPGDHPLPAGTQLTCFLERDDVRDVLVHPGGKQLADLPPGTRVGTSSVRRAAQLRRLNSTVLTVPIRGNVNSRLRKLDDGECDALLLARSGLLRIGFSDRITETLATDVMAPPIGAGILAIQCREDRPEVHELLSPINHRNTEIEAKTERMLLAELNGHCNSPIAGHAVVQGGVLTFEACVFALDGSEEVRDSARGLASEPEQVAHSVAKGLVDKGARRIIDALI